MKKVQIKIDDLVDVLRIVFDFKYGNSFSIVEANCEMNYVRPGVWKILIFKKNANVRVANTIRTDPITIAEFMKICIRDGQ